MLIYLVQHADAKREEEDLSRPLSEKGLRDIEKVASYVSKLNIKVHKIFHSNKLRAMQTAEVLSENLKPTRGTSEVDGLTPLDDPQIWAERLKGIPDDVILVGHLPHLAKLSSLLLCGNVERNIVLFKMAGFVCLKRDDAAAWSVQWMLTPEIVV
ncbi:MAG: phosphohistidine phosphatase SixA [Thermodesulfovibrio sp. RBG_19FT_COMBO_42_12]|jgi:phosphohistidine phosphatase|nr:MAG: phosphohistidine phosphatase SixA [Thermodesulfovibrio sp. RBG_19FT_COMBO_42_12]